jgi:hypothetical protein
MMTTAPTVADVRLILDTKLGDAAIQAFIDDATVMTGPCSLGWDCATRKTIIKYIAAHLLVLAASKGGGAVSQRSLGDASESYSRQSLGTGLSETSYGQSALNFDPTGCLANLGKRRGFAKTL